MQRVVGLDADACETGLLFAWQILVEKCERGAGAVVAERFRAHAPDFFLVSCFSRSRGQVTEHLPASVLDHPFRHVERVGQHTPHTAVVIWNRAVQKREVALLEVVVAVEREELVGQGADGLALCKDRVEPRADEIPRFGKHLAATATQRPWVLCTDDHTIGIVVEHRVVRAPGNEHRMPGAQHDAHAGSQRLRPCATGPRTVVDQSTARIRAPMSPPPANTDSVSCFSRDP